MLNLRIWTVLLLCGIYYTVCDICKNDKHYAVTTDSHPYNQAEQTCISRNLNFADFVGLSDAQVTDLFQDCGLFSQLTGAFWTKKPEPASPCKVLVSQSNTVQFLAHSCAENIGIMCELNVGTTLNMASFPPQPSRPAPTQKIPTRPASTQQFLSRVPRLEPVTQWLTSGQTEATTTSGRNTPSTAPGQSAAATTSRHTSAVLTSGQTTTPTTSGQTFSSTTLGQTSAPLTVGKTPAVKSAVYRLIYSIKPPTVAGLIQIGNDTYFSNTQNLPQPLQSFEFSTGAPFIVCYSSGGQNLWLQAELPETPGKQMVKVKVRDATPEVKGMVLSEAQPNLLSTARHVARGFSELLELFTQP